MRSEQGVRSDGAGRKSLAGRSFAILLSLSLAVMVVVTVIVTAACFSVYESDAEQSLMESAEAVAAGIEGKSEEEAAESLARLPFVDMRCTLVLPDGDVAYDNWADPASMDNHAGRAEIVAAREDGNSVFVRRSETLGEDSVYAAVLLDNGCVLRLGETRWSLASFLGSLSLPLAIALIAAALAAFVASRLLTRRIVRPLQKVNLADPLDNDAYVELQPLLERVDVQKTELTLRNEELAKAIDARREFTSNVSHEMKTPLQVIGGYAELMEDGLTDPADNARIAALIRVESESMRSLIDDVLTLSRLDEGADIGHDLVDMAAVCVRVADRLQPAAESRGIAVGLDLADGAIVEGPEALVEQMVYNLVDNAIRYNREGGSVGVILRVEGSMAMLEVSDEGPGIPVELRERVFERFFRVDASRSRETGGTGLGLAIVKHAAMLMGGSVQVGEASGGGALMIVELPLARLESTRQETPSPATNIVNGIS